MKKLFVILIAFCCTLSIMALDLMDISGDVGLGYLNYMMVTTYDNSKLKTALGDTLKSALGEGNLKIDDPKSKDIYNAFAIGLGIKVSYFYTNLTVGFPFKQIPTGNDPLENIFKNLNVDNKLNSSLIFDGQLGGGITLLKNKPLNIFAGVGLAVNYIRTKRDLPEAFAKTLLAKNLTEIRTSSMFGAGIDIAAKYFLTKNIGICVDLKETVYFVPILNRRLYKGTSMGNEPFTYTIINEKSKDKKSIIKSSWANNFTIRLGVAFKL